MTYSQIITQTRQLAIQTSGTWTSDFQINLRSTIHLMNERDFHVKALSDRVIKDILKLKGTAKSIRILAPQTPLI